VCVCVCVCVRACMLMRACKFMGVQAASQACARVGPAPGAVSAPQPQHCTKTAPAPAPAAAAPSRLLPALVMWAAAAALGHSTALKREAHPAPAMEMLRRLSYVKEATFMYSFTFFTCGGCARVRVHVGRDWMGLRAHGCMRAGIQWS